MDNPQISFPEFFHHVPRLSSSNLCTLILLAIWNQKSSIFKTEEMAAFLQCDTATVRREVLNLTERGLIDVSYTEQGATMAIRSKYATWPLLPDFERERG